MDKESFTHLVAQLTTTIRGHRLDAELEAFLNREAPATGPLFKQLFDACSTGVAEGWMCQRSAGGIRYGRVLKPSPEIGNYSVDVVEMTDVVGPHHAHPNGEIDLIMPLDPSATFDNHPAGWLVYGPRTAHRPTVAGGKALVLYLLPEGAIDFSAPAAD